MWNLWGYSRGLIWLPFRCIFLKIKKAYLSFTKPKLVIKKTGQ
jgi:hypothetical protein